MGWDGMGHRGLRNKWPGLPVAMLFPVFGSIEHLNELEQRNIGIRRGLDCLVLEAELCIRLFVPVFFFLFFFLFSFFAILISSSSSFLSNHWILITLLLRRTPDFDEINFLPFQPVSYARIHRSFLRNFFLWTRFTSAGWKMRTRFVMNIELVLEK